MIAMQYKISLPDDYDMRIIQKRVQDNGNKTDGFQDLLFKAYLISEKGTFGNKKNEYAPLYLWKRNQGMNKFIFGGFYNNILNSFGWQQINIGIVSTDELKDNFSKSKYVLEIESAIPVTQHMKALKFSLDFDDCTGKVIIYNPDKWRYVEFYFFEKVPNAAFNSKVYRLLALGGGAGWYFKIHRPKQQKAAEPEEDYSSYDEPDGYDDEPPWDVDDEDEGGDE